MTWEEALEEHVEKNEREFDRVAEAFGEVKAFIIDQTTAITNRFDEFEAKVERRFDAHDRRFEAIEGRLDRIEGRLDQIEGRLDQIDGRLDRIDGRLDQMDGRLDRIDGRLDQMDRRFDRLDDQIALLVKAIVRP